MTKIYFLRILEDRNPKPSISRTIPALTSMDSTQALCKDLVSNKIMFTRYSELDLQHIFLRDMVQFTTDAKFFFQSIMSWNF